MSVAAAPTPSARSRPAPLSDTPAGRCATATSAAPTAGTDRVPAPAIVISGVSKVFGSAGARDEVRALQDVSLEVGQHELISLIGPSGCGKSTLLRLIGDLLEPTSGSITIKGKSPSSARQDRDYGIVFQ